MVELAADHERRADGPATVAAVLMAVAVIGAPIAAAGWFALCPQYGNPSCPSSADPAGAMMAFQTAPPALLDLFLLLNLIVPYLMPLSILALGFVAWRGSSRLALVGSIAGWVGAIPWGFFSLAIFQAVAAVRASQSSSYPAVVTTAFGDWHLLVVATGWVLGHLLGYLLIAFALLRLRGFPRWAGATIAVAVPVIGPIAYGTGLGLLQVAGYVAIGIASIPVARVLLARGGSAANAVIA
jgi:hypothetical protein